MKGWILVALVLAVCEGRLHLDVFFESKCSDSEAFMRDQLAPAVAKLGPYFDVDVTAYGKASDTANKYGGFDFTCQHGPEECYGNKMLACARKHIPHHEAYLNFTLCAMATADPAQANQKCSGSDTMQYHKIHLCATSVEGQVALHQRGVYQRAAAPTLNYVPWMIVNGAHSTASQDKAEHHLMALVCESMDDSPLPAPCHQHS